MAPSPDNDTPPKAPDKNNKTNLETNKTTTTTTMVTTKGSNPKRDQALNALDERQLRDLLDEAVNYKNPNDREGKSLIFKQLLSEAEEGLRNEMAAQAGGSELVRYCNQQAKRNSRHHNNNNNNNNNTNNNRKSSTSSSASASVTKNSVHGGSLNNLTKDELYDMSKYRTKKSVSARQREGGSLPCNVNTGIASTVEFLEEARRKKELLNQKTLIVNDLESERLLEHDSLAHDYNEQLPLTEIVHYPINQPAKFTSRATLQVNNVDDPIQLTHLESNIDKKKFISIPPNTTTSAITTTTTTVTTATTTASAITTTTTTTTTTNRLLDDGKKVDENGNALQQQQQQQQNPTSTLKTKRKKNLPDKNVVVCNSESVKGHRSDIINDVDKLVEFIGVEKNDHQNTTKNRSNLKSKQLNRHNTTGAVTSTSSSTSSSSSSSTSSTTSTTDDNKSKKQQRAHSSKSKDNRSKLKKSNSLGEISTTSLEDFAFSNKDKVVLRHNNNNNNNNSCNKNNNSNNGGNSDNKPRERRSWGNMDVISGQIKIEETTATTTNIKPLPLQNLYNNTSIENLESAEFRVVTKKKKCKKQRRNSFNSRLNQSTQQHTVTTTTTNTTSSGQTMNKNYHNKMFKSTEFNRRKSACSVPHSEKSNDSSSDVDSVHSLPIDTQKCIDLVVNNNNNNNNNNMDDGNNNNNNNNNNLPISYADRLKSGVNENYNIIPINTNNNKKLMNEKVPKLENTTTIMITNDVNSNNIKIINQSPPPDVHNIKNFPSITKPNLPSLTTITTQQQQQQSTVIVDKINKNNKNKTIATTTTNNIKNNLKNIPTEQIQQSNNDGINIVENLEIQYSANLPPDIPTVQSIEKMQLIGSGHPYDDNTGAPPICGSNQQPQQQQQPQHYHNQQQQQLNKNTATIKNNIKTLSLSLLSSSTTTTTTTTSKSSSSSSSSSTSSSSSKTNDDCSLDCDSNNERTISVDNNNSNNNNNNNNNIVNNSNNQRPPPVVILSGLGSSQKEAVRDLVFGFDINEQLLLEDDDDDDDDDDDNIMINNSNDDDDNVVIDNDVDNTTITTTKTFNCDDFIARYRPPETYTTTSHNHDKVINYIGSAWEDVMNMSNGNVLYYSELQ